ncbi:MAG: putative rRNA-processing protein ebp2 [Piptocephalis tieghemiana]|nr:MAG: putative rRNA-processing protein ebp2 [Piptocephalis tieghemiana]
MEEEEKEEEEEEEEEEEDTEEEEEEEEDTVMEEKEDAEEEEEEQKVISNAPKPKERNRPLINEQATMEALRKHIHLDLPFMEHMTVDSSVPTVVEDAENDLEREMAFYRQALEGAMKGREQLKAVDYPITRPDDYYAEMLKNDEHMEKVRQRLLEEAASMKASEAAKRLRDLKKFGKKVQAEKQLERQKNKAQELERIKLLKKKRKGTEMTDDHEDSFDVAIEEAVAQDRLAQEGGRKDKSKRGLVIKERNYGFGGKKRFSKENTAESVADARSFNPAKNKQGFSGVRKAPGQKKRPGKSKRAAGRGRK